MNPMPKKFETCIDVGPILILRTTDFTAVMMLRCLVELFCLKIKRNDFFYYSALS